MVHYREENLAGVGFTWGAFTFYIDGISVFFLPSLPHVDMRRHLQTPSFCLRSFLTIYPAPSPKILRHVLTPPPNFAQKQEKLRKFQNK